MVKTIDNFLNAITMYRLMLYALVIMTVSAVLFAYLNISSFDSGWLVISVISLLVTCLIANRILALISKAPTNIESAAITALILFFVMTPAHNWYSGLELAAVGGLAMASKYILAIRKKHLFNPAAAGAVLGGLIGVGSSSWWVSELSMLPVVTVLGFLIVRKVRRFKMFFTFVVASLIAGIAYSMVTGELTKISFGELIIQRLTVWPLIFFGTIMFTEPLTTPPGKKWRLLYAVIVGGLFGAQVRLGSLYLTSEMALVVGNLFSFLVSFKKRLLLQLKNQQLLAPKIFEFIFTADRSFNFLPGQYLEWTLVHAPADNRGDRRYFTIASSPTEPDLRIAVKITDKSSSYKKTLVNLKPGDRLVAGQLYGDFTLPNDFEKKLVFIAGRLGITPFRSMVKYIIDTKQTRDVVLFYASSDANEFVYRELFEEAKKYGLKTVYVVTNPNGISPAVPVKVGPIDRAMIEAEVADYQKRTYYLSGPPGMVNAYKKLLRSLRISRRQIKTDYFPGY